ncbi:SPOR domain-containing protein [Roseovarius aquimarinus]|uniref:SPOR domain-containing protein n=1 Tax=Roseovarius aquimarinus TaxID=1229156 RepID=A0ABW7I3E9_9RHOB
MAEYHQNHAARGQHEPVGAYHDAQSAPRWEDAPQVSTLGRATYALGSLVSVGLVIGLGVWGYKLLVRDVSGVPVIRAAEGPLRIQPEDPGGRQAMNQGLSVNEIAAIGTATPAPDQLILAPAPLDLSEDDAPAARPEMQAETAAAPEEAAPQPEVVEVEADEIEDAPESGTDAMLALAEAISEGITPMEPLSEVTESTPQMAEETSAPDGAVGASLRPKARPAGLSNIRQVAATQPETTAREIDADSIAVGTRLAQLGAFSSEEIAREEWDKLGARFEEYLAGKSRVIQRATSGGRTFYRLRAMGFEDLADARRFCSALVAEKAECIPVVTR